MKRLGGEVDCPLGIVEEEKRCLAIHAFQELRCFSWQVQPVSYEILRTTCNTPEIPFGIAYRSSTRAWEQNCIKRSRLAGTCLLSSCPSMIYSRPWADFLEYQVYTLKEIMKPLLNWWIHEPYWPILSLCVLYLVALALNFSTGVTLSRNRLLNEPFLVNFFLLFFTELKTQQSWKRKRLKISATTKENSKSVLKQQTLKNTLRFCSEINLENAAP